MTKIGKLKLPLFDKDPLFWSVLGILTIVGVLLIMFPSGKSIETQTVTLVPPTADIVLTTETITCWDACSRFNYPDWYYAANFCNAGDVEMKATGGTIEVPANKPHCCCDRGVDVTTSITATTSIGTTTSIDPAAPTTTLFGKSSCNDMCVLYGYKLGGSCAKSLFGCFSGTHLRAGDIYCPKGQCCCKSKTTTTTPATTTTPTTSIPVTTTISYTCGNPGDAHTQTCPSGYGCVYDPPLDNPPSGSSFSAQGRGNICMSLTGGWVDVSGLLDGYSVHSSWGGGRYSCFDYDMEFGLEKSTYKEYFQLQGTCYDHAVWACALGWEDLVVDEIRTNGQCCAWSCR